MDALSVVALGMAKKALDNSSGGGEKYLHRINCRKAQAIDFYMDVITDSPTPITNFSGFLGILDTNYDVANGWFKYSATAYANVFACKKYGATAITIKYYHASTGTTEQNISTSDNPTIEDNVIAI